MTWDGPGSCLDCGEREQETQWGLCEPCSEARTERVRASIRDDGADEQPSSADSADATEPTDPSGQLSITDF